MECDCWEYKLSDDVSIYFKENCLKKMSYDEGYQDESFNLLWEDLFLIALLKIIDGIVNELKTQFQAL